MCDYSLMNVPNRLARENEELVTYRFPTGSLGMAAPADVNRQGQPKVAGFWANVRAWFNPPAATAVCAVCLPPGARLKLTDIPVRLRAQWGAGVSAEVVFVQITAAANTYRDAVKFSTGRIVGLQYLPEGMPVKVLDLGADAGTPDLDERLARVL